MKQTFRILLLLMALMASTWSITQAAPADTPFDGMWRKLNQWGSPDNGVNVYPNSTPLGLWYGADEEGEFEYRFEKLIAKDANSMTFSCDANPDISIILTYNPDRQELNVRINYKGQSQPIINETYSDRLHKLNYVYANGLNEVKGGTTPTTLLGYAELGDRFRSRNIFENGYHGIYMPDGTPAWIDGGNFDTSEPILDDSFPTEWSFHEEYKSNGQTIGQGYTLSINKIGGNRVVVTDEMMAPIRLSDGQMVGTSGSIGYLGTIQGNRIILTKVGNGWAAEAGDYDEFTDLTEPLEVIYIPAIMNGIMFDGRTYSKSYY